MSRMDDYNYYHDRRVMAAQKSSQLKNFCEKDMTVEVLIDEELTEEVEEERRRPRPGYALLHVKYKVCDLCEVAGKS